MKKTKIICTIGPASDSFSTLSQLVHAGMDIMRLNFSHGHHDDHAKRIKTLREACKYVKKPVAIMLDTKGPEIRTLRLKDHQPVYLQSGASFVITTDQQVVGDEHCVAVTYAGIVNDINVGHHILIDDGLIELVVEQRDSHQLFCRVLNSGMLGEHKGVNLPNVSINLPALSVQDKHDLIFGCEQHVDFIAASFIRKRADVEMIRQFLDEHNGNHIAIIAKIENQEGLDNFDDILDVADGIMVARGDLGVEIPIEEVILSQKMMVEKCNQHAKPVIIATQMLESMTVNPRPTRAEAGDVANAILDGADAVMLSGETAKGRYPVETVAVMAKICQKTDLDFSNNPYYVHRIPKIDHTTSHSVVVMAEELQSPVIAVMTELGTEARAIRQYFPKADILAMTWHEWVFKQLLLVKGVCPHLIDKPVDIDTFVTQCRTIAISEKLTEQNTIMVVAANNQNKDDHFSTTISLKV